MFPLHLVFGGTLCHLIGILSTYPQLPLPGPIHTTQKNILKNHVFFKLPFISLEKPIRYCWFLVALVYLLIQLWAYTTCRCVACVSTEAGRVT